MKPLIFVSCGQVTAAEVTLGNALCDIITSDRRYEPYFAENQSSLEGVTANILAKLIAAEAFVAVMHPRGDVSIPSASGTYRTITRASVWIEQEIAILTALAQAQSRPIKIQLYVKRGVAREGLRTFIMANPYVFDSDDEVVPHFRHVLSNWKLQPGPRALAATEEELLGRCADTGIIEIVRTDQRGSYVRIPGHSFVDAADHSIAAGFREAVHVLLENGLVRKTKPNKFELTAAGFARARSIVPDPAWLTIEPVVQLQWPMARDQPAQLRCFLRNEGSRIPSEIDMVIRFPRKYLVRPSGESLSQPEGYEDLRVHLPRETAAAIRPGAFETRIMNQQPIVAVPFWIDGQPRKTMMEEVEIAVESNGVRYVARFSLEQLLEQEPRYYALSRSEQELSHLLQL